LMKGGWRPWLSAMGTNAGIAVFLVIVALLAGWQALLLVNLPTLVIASSIGVWLFYVQHQFEGTYWARRDDWDLTEAALKGASHYHLPQPLRWMTANIGVHHVHHIASRIPFYRLPAARLSVPQSIRAVPLSLWDEASEQLISFRQLARQTRAAAAA
ncbi:MAG TPA: fatty acid desaturase, partial [Phenylobacterium sp.]|nr:fatty acid desaturase [Phenylobacterium sp.]